MDEVVFDGHCAICRSPAKWQNAGSRIEYDCGRCGKFLVDGEFLRTKGWPQVEEFDRERIHLYSGFAREYSEIVSQPAARRELAVFCEETLPSIRRQLPKSITERADKLLWYLWRVTRQLGQFWDLDVNLDFSLAYAVDFHELHAIVEYLSGLDLIKKQPIRAVSVSLTVRGFERVERLRGENRESAQGFIAMSFDDGLLPLLNGPIDSAIKAAGYKPMRIDRKDHNNQIVDEMLAEIRRSRFVVADFTSHRNGVYFEAGFAMGLGIPVIWLVRKDHMEDAHFDTKQYSFLAWESGDDLGERLYNRIRATIGTGPIAPESSMAEKDIITAMKALTPEAAPTRND